MINQTSWRNYCLGITSIGINLTVVYMLLVPSVGNRRVADFEFPQQIALSSDKVMANRSSQQQPISGQGEVIKAQQQYEYTQDGQSINLAISYLVGTRGDVSTYLRNYTPIEEGIIKTKEVKQLNGVGYHALFNDRNYAYLSSCISPHSPSNVTQKQFSQHRYQHDLKWQVGLNWLWGKASIRDRRCLWVLLSTPVTQGNIQTDYRTLETAWQDIYQWWLPNFPNLTSNKADG